MCLHAILSLLKVVINDDMVEQLTPPDTVDPAERKEILKDLARALKKQGSHILASKKYTQAGDRIRAMKCLVRGGRHQSCHSVRLHLPQWGDIQAGR